MLYAGGRCSQFPRKQFLALGHTFFFLLWGWCAGWLITGLLSDGDSSDETGLPTQALLFFLLLQVLQDVLCSLMRTRHCSGWKWLLLGRRKKKHNTVHYDTHTLCVPPGSLMTFSNSIPKYKSNSYWLNRDTPGATSLISLFLLRHHTKRDRKLEDSLSELILWRDSNCAPKIWVTVVGIRCTVQCLLDQTGRKILCPCRILCPTWTMYWLDLPQLRTTRKLKSLVRAFRLQHRPGPYWETAMLTLMTSLLTDWSSLIGSCTLPLHWGTQGGSNIGTEGIPRTGEGKVKFILGGGI